MSGHHSFSQLTSNFDPQRQQVIQNKVEGLKASMTLAELRKAIQLSQAELATALKVQQPAISRLEQRTDMYVSHLRRVIEAMGGQLDIIARFPHGEVLIDNFQELSDSAQSPAENPPSE